ncbi:hypothetical protein RBH29_16780, partial [Herbivorax sp. ANBcel31]|uniref:hypothetical protein n=1 Tax=Herbivorax sp. ANBcel31 TaxID=3069754 RepID=UPI0027B262A0
HDSHEDDHHEHDSHEDDHHEHDSHEDDHHEHDSHEHDHHEHEIEDANFLLISGWAAIIIIFLVGIFIESIGTALIIKFFNKIRPDITNQNNTVADK